MFTGASGGSAACRARRSSSPYFTAANLDDDRARKARKAGEAVIEADRTLPNTDKQLPPPNIHMPHGPADIRS